MPNADLKTLYTTPLVLYIALLISTMIYGVIIFVAVLPTPPLANPPPAVFAYIMMGWAAATIAIIPFLRTRMAPPMRDPESMSEAEPVVEQSVAQPAVGRWFTANVVTWALCESIAIDGLVLTFLTHELTWFLGFAGAALVNFAIYRPQRAHLLAVLRAAAH